MAKHDKVEDVVDELAGAIADDNEFDLFDKDKTHGDTEESVAADDAKQPIGFRVRLHMTAFEQLVSMEKGSGIDRNVLVDMAIQALMESDDENLLLFYQIASARRSVNLAGIRGVK